MTWGNASGWMLLLVVPLFFILRWLCLHSQKRRLSRFIDPLLWERVVPGFSYRKRLLRMSLWGLALFLVIVAFLRPQYGVRLEEKPVHKGSILVVMDVSWSMLTPDRVPNRLEASKQILKSLLSRMVGYQMGLEVFSGSAFLNCPMTDDSDALGLFVEGIQAGMVSQSGSNLASALALASKSINPPGAVVLLTDGEAFGEGPVLDVVSRFPKGIPIYTVGVGTPLGQPIPIKDAVTGVVTYKKDRQGQLVVSKLQAAVLAKISQKTGGESFILTDHSLVVEALSRRLSSAKVSSKPWQEIPEDRYQWCLFLAFFLLVTEWVISERKGLFLGLKSSAVMGVIWMVVGGGASPLLASSFGAYWDVSQANQAFKKHDLETAEKGYRSALAKDPKSVEIRNNIGVLLAAKQQPDRALSFFSEALHQPKRSPKNEAALLYNLGNAQLQTGDSKGASQRYIESLKRNPQDNDARYNLELALRKPPSVSKKSPPKQKDRSRKAQQDQAKSVLNALEQQEKEAMKQKQQNDPTPMTEDNDW